jgi:hypothetical protein
MGRDEVQATAPCPKCGYFKLREQVDCPSCAGHAQRLARLSEILDAPPMAIVSERMDAMWQGWRVWFDLQRIGDGSWVEMHRSGEAAWFVCANCDPEASSVAGHYWIRVQDRGYLSMELCDGCQRLVATVLGADATVPEDSTLGRLLDAALEHELATHPRATQPSADLDLPF